MEARECSTSPSTSLRLSEWLTLCLNNKNWDAPDSTLILLTYRHGLRVSELVALRWEQIDFGGGTIYINRLKHGVSSTHPLRGRELRVLRQLNGSIQALPICLFPNGER